MKFKFLALALSLLVLSSVEVQAKVAPSQKALISKDTSAVTYFGAEDSSSITILPSYHQITFTQDHLSHGKSIKPNAASAEFLLKEGKYFISFTGTFQSTGGTPFIDIGLQLGPNVIFANTTSQERFGSGSGETFVIGTLYKVIEIEKPTKLSIVTKNVQTGTSAVLTTRSIVIEKL